MDTMTGSEAFTALLETFQGCTRRGERATLFLETKNGNEVATLKVELPARPGTTSVGLARKKSPSTVKRDKARMEKFVQRKTLQETWCPPATSSPSIKTEKYSNRVGIRQNIYTSGFFRTQKFTPKVRDSRQIQCYQKGVICDKFNAKKNKKHPLC